MGRTREEEPVTPAGRLFLQPEIGQVIHCLIGGKNPINVDVIKSVMRDSMMVKHPRFTSLMVTDRHGREYWKKTTVDVDRHVIVLRDPVGGDPTLDEEAAVNDYLADLAVSSPLGTDKPLWEIHLLMAHKCAVLRVHHALGDGISLMSMLLTACRKAEDPEQLPTIKAAPGGSSSSTSGNNNSSNCTNRRGRRRKVLWGLVKMVWFTVVYGLKFLVRTLWVRDKRTAVSGGAGIELWPRKLGTAKFLLDDMKTVKNAVPHATINDVLFGVISSGLSTYLDTRSPKALQEGLQITGLAMVNLRPQPGLQDMSKLMESNSTTRWGNKFGVILLPVYYHKSSSSDPLHHLKRAKEMIDRKKQSFEPYFTYKICYFIMSIFGPKLASLLNYRVMCNTTFTISNMIGPGEEITIAGNPVAYMRTNSTSLPHAITMHMVTYAGRADMQILVAKDIIPDPQVLAKCFEDALLEMKEAATRN